MPIGFLRWFLGRDANVMRREDISLAAAVKKTFCAATYKKDFRIGTQSGPEHGRLQLGI